MLVVALLNWAISETGWSKAESAPCVVALPQSFSASKASRDLDSRQVLTMKDAAKEM